MIPYCMTFGKFEITKGLVRILSVWIVFAVLACAFALYEVFPRKHAEVASGMMVYVSTNGNDIVAVMNDEKHPYRSIQAAVDAAANSASSTNRITVFVCPGAYYEPVITMSNFVSLSGTSKGECDIHGAVRYPKTFSGKSEVLKLSLSSSNCPSLSVIGGNSLSEVEIKGCQLTSTYYDGFSNMELTAYNEGVLSFCGTRLTVNPSPERSNEVIVVFGSRRPPCDEVKKNAINAKGEPK